MASLNVQTPSLVYDFNEVASSVSCLRQNLSPCKYQLLYTLKASNADALLHKIAKFVDGFAVSSFYEGLLAQSHMPINAKMHLTTPGLQSEALTGIDRLTHVTFNSISQHQRFSSLVSHEISNGLRLNMGRSLVTDKRYDPSRPNSKLGIPLKVAADYLCTHEANSIEGLHFHNSCLSESWESLHDMVSLVLTTFANKIENIKWINLGGGYVWDNRTDFSPLIDAINAILNRSEIEVILEPGAGIVNKAGYLISSVVDLFDRDGLTVAVLDSTVNHLPEVFEYQFEPDLQSHTDDGPLTYQLAGCSCLAGDIFGTYSFNEPLEIGSRVVFENVGAYSIVKAHMFNGINLPTIYTLTESGELLLTKQFTYEDFASRCGVDTRATV